MVAGASIYWAISRSLLASFDKGLVDEAIALSALIEIGENGVQSEITEHGHDPFQIAQRVKYYEVLSADNVLIELSSGLDKNRLPVVDVPFNIKRLHRELMRDVALPNGSSGRLLAWDFLPTIERDMEGGSEADAPTPHSTGARLVLAKETRGLEQDLGSLRNALLLVLAVTAAVSAPAIWLVTGAALRPLHQVAEQIAKIGPNDLSSSLSSTEAPTETRLIVERLNDFLARLRRAFERERSFSANVAHELRTPIAGLRANLEMILAAPREPDDYRATLGKCLRITIQTEEVVETLLMLSRADAGELPTRAEAFKISRALPDLWRPFSALADERQLTIEWLVDNELLVWANEPYVRVILRNLFDNALSYTEVGGNVRLSAQSTGSMVAIQIENTGCLLTAEQMSNVGRRFWRGDESRSATGRHAGLGLALGIELAALQGGSLELSCKSGGRFCATLQLPRPRPVDLASPPSVARGNGEPTAKMRGV
jgi:two-component system sensor histidine kinase QseC